MLRKSKLSLIILAIIAISVISAWYVRSNPNIVVTPPVKPFKRVLLIPLDSRPPCTQFITQLGKIGNLEIVIPPAEIMDNYNTPANKSALRQWLETTLPNTDAAIISTDMLIHGGLLASRLSKGTDEDVNATITLLQKLHQQYPQIKLYAFSIIPRLLIADNSENKKYQNSLLKYSVLKDQIYTFENPKDIEEMSALEKQIPSEVIAKYTTLYEQNIKVDWVLTDLAEKGVIDGVVLGQDDGQPFGIPNITKQRLINYIHKKGLSDKVFVTRGTDEVALTLLGHLFTKFTQKQPKIFVAYSDPNASQIIMPFMPHTVAQTVQEKIAIAGGIISQDRDEADYVLYVHVGTSKTKFSSLLNAVQEIKTLLKSGQKVALVDLSEKFLPSDSLLPLLLRENAPIINLIAYAGWNTTSNSIGTAITQATLFVQQARQTESLNDMLYASIANAEFLTARFIDDLYYQKEIFPYMKDRLATRHINSNNLENHYEETNNLIASLVRSKGNSLFSENLCKHPLLINYSSQTKAYYLSDLSIDVHLPWDRIFEISIQPNITLQAIQ